MNQELENLRVWSNETSVLLCGVHGFPASRKKEKYSLIKCRSVKAAITHSPCAWTEADPDPDYSSTVCVCACVHVIVCICINSTCGIVYHSLFIRGISLSLSPPSAQLRERLSQAFKSTNPSMCVCACVRAKCFFKSEVVKLICISNATQGHCSLRAAAAAAAAAVVHE